MKLKNPPGYTGASPAAKLASSTRPKSATSSSSLDKNAALKTKKAWEAAFAPAKAVPMNAFMLWMSGSGVQIFSIMITVMLLFNPLKAIMGIDAVFAPFAASTQSTGKRDTSTLLPKAVFIGCQLCVIALGVWKCQSMGLLPTATSDWLSFMPPPETNVLSFRLE